MVEQVRDGVIFTLPPDLPRGRHALSREEILAAQRERLMVAVAELMSDRGYREIGVGDLATRAHVSRAAFYECFATKDDCVFAAYDRFIAVLLEQVGSVAEATRTWESTTRAVVEAYLGTLQSDLVVARAFQVEMDALGREARCRRREALVGMATFLKSRRDQLWPGSEDVPLSAYVGAVCAVRQLASDRLDAEKEPDLVGMVDEVAGWVTRMLTPRR